MTITIFALFFGSFFLGLILTWTLHRWVVRHEVTEAQLEAKEILDEAESLSQDLQNETTRRMEEFAHEAQDRFEKDIRKTEEKNEILTIKVRDRESQLQRNLQKRESFFQRKSSELAQYEMTILQQQERYEKKKNEKTSLLKRYRQRLLEQGPLDLTTLTDEIKKNLVQEEERKAARLIEHVVSETHSDAEKNARYYLHVALNRFARPYCEERGIGLVYFPNEEVQKRVIGKDREHLNFVEKLCGVDISINNEFHSASCLGFDPVRRELARLTLERLLHEKILNEKRIEEIVVKTKRDLFRKIRQDGQRVAKELNMRDFHSEIINMLGALRYRYSFSQNQHFHCAEVGWICGLLSTEMGEPQSSGRRAGLLHDIGKSMDHSMEGGHAVIGADFIQKHGERQEIVHAVRAHHFDEQPQTNLAYLVIAADAVSGARPGARRSTVDSYNQKMADLQNIGNSFSGVSSTYILSAGREVRVVVDSSNVDDLTALDLSKKIAQKIEEECSYPGQIRVTVVRESQAIEYAR